MYIRITYQHTSLNYRDYSISCFHKPTNITTIKTAKLTNERTLIRTPLAPMRAVKSQITISTEYLFLHRRYCH